MSDLEVTAWTELDALPDQMDELADQVSRILAHARTWVCQRAGFEPSPLCLLRPLAEAMELVADAFAQAERIAVEDWADLRAGVVAASADLRAVDASVAGRMPVVS